MGARIWPHKAEHAVDIEAGAIVAVTVQPANEGNTTTIVVTVAEAGERVNPERRSEIVTDKGYHSRESDKRSPRLESARTARSRSAGRSGGEDNIGNSKPYMPTAAAFGTSEASGYCGNAARSSSVGTNTSTNAVECDGSTCEVGKTS